MDMCTLITYIKNVRLVLVNSDTITILIIALIVGMIRLSPAFRF